MTILAKIKALPAYQPNTWGTMCKGDNDDERFFPARVWIRRDAVLKIIEAEYDRPQVVQGVEAVGSDGGPLLFIKESPVVLD